MPRLFQLEINVVLTDAAVMRSLSKFERQMEEELQSGQYEGGWIAGGVATLSILTSTPEICLREALQLLNGAGFQASGAYSSDLESRAPESMYFGTQRSALSMA